MCKDFIIINGKNYPFYQESEFGNCKYAVTAPNEAEMSVILEEAQGMDDYVKHSKPFIIPEGILVFIIFSK